ncbi:MAG: lipopolysaccharide heptosyltransferase II [Gammaproteobacteria bacterium]|nr:lipopolysaccharide heptosyltransferase II [Gammaproteobacteria bacterium]
MSTAATLIVGPSWVGDMVMANALFKHLKSREPNRPLDVLAPGWSLPVVARMPEIRDGIAAETGHGELGFSKRRKIGRALQDRYDRAIVLPRSLKAALVPWFAKIPRRTGYRGESRYWLINDMRPFDRDALDQTVKRFVALGTEQGEASPEILYPTLAIDHDNQATVIDKLNLSTAKPVVAFMPGAEYGPAKCWPLDQFAELANKLANDRYSVWILGSEKDHPAGEEIAGVSDAINICGKTSLADVIDLLAFAQQAVSNDSGLMHIAAAVGTHTHAIYGSSTPKFTPPLTDSRDIHYLDLDCSPCFERECPLGHLRCLKEIRPESVYGAICRRTA